jgi:hypothetical protein
MAEGARWLLVVVFALAAVEKGATLWTRSVAWHPVMLVSRARRRHATTLMGAALAADLVAVALLLAVPVAGAAAGAALVVAYSILSLPVHGGRQSVGSCRCFWKVLNTTTRRGLLVRNVLLAAFALAAAAVPPATVTLAGLAAGGVLLGVVVAVVAATERAQPLGIQPSESERTEGGVAR